MQASVLCFRVVLITCVGAIIHATPQRNRIEFVRADYVQNSSLVQPLLNTCRFSDVINVFNYGLCFDFCEDDDLCVLIKIGSNSESCQLCLYDPEQPSVHGAFDPEQIYVIVEELNVNIDECENGPCENNGTCVDRVSSYTCTCIPGFSGNRCQENIDDCQNEPCENGGTCVDGVNSYTCTCIPGFSGDTCGDECNKPLISGDEFHTPDDALTASSSYYGYLPHLSRLTSTWAWYPDSARVGDWIQADLGQVYKIAGVKTLGDPSLAYYVTEYRVSYMLNEQWHDARAQVGSSIFDGNTNHVTPFENWFEEAVIAAVVKLYIMGFQNRPALRWELKGCLNVDGDECENEPCENGGTCVDGVNSYTCSCVPGYTGDTCQGACNKPLITGNEFRIPDDSLTASSFYNAADGNNPPYLSRLTSSSAWYPESDSPGSWIQADLGQVYKISSVVTKGDSSGDWDDYGPQYVTEYTLTYKLNDGQWQEAFDQDGSRLFDGNTDQYTAVENWFEEALVATAVRLYPVTSPSWPGLRWEMKGCSFAQCEAIVGNSCFVGNTTEMNWQSARNSCAQSGGRLAEAYTAEIEDAIQRVLPGGVRRYWLGGSDVEVEGRWIWIGSRRPFNYTNWKHNQPSNGGSGENYLEMQDNEWNDRGAGIVPFVCEYLIN